MKKSMLDVAYTILEGSDKPLAFRDMLAQVSETLGMSEEEVRTKMAQFYTNLSVDGRFVCCTDNYWEVRKKVPFGQVHIDMNDAYNDKEDSDDDDYIDDVEKELGEEDLETGDATDADVDSDDDDAEIEEVTDDGEAE